MNQILKPRTKKEDMYVVSDVAVEAELEDTASSKMEKKFRILERNKNPS